MRDRVGDAADFVKEAATQPRPRADWNFVSPINLIGEPPPRRWIVDQWLPAGHVTILYGDGGLGKTLLLQQLMTSAAVGHAWCGIAVERCRSLALFCEDDNDELHRRQNAINLVYGATNGDLGGMTWTSGIGEDNTLLEFDADGSSMLTEAFHRLNREAVAWQAGLIVVDTAADTFGGNEINRRQVRQFVGRALGKLARDTGAAVLLAAHPSRSGMSASGDGDGGSTAWSNTARSRWSLTRPECQAGEQPDTDARILSRRKSNYGSSGDTIALRWKRGVLIPQSTPHGLDAQAIRQHADEAFLALLARHNASGIRVGQSNRGANWAPKLFAKAPDRNGFTLADFEAALGRLLASQTIKMHDFGRASRPEMGLVVTA